MMIWLMSRSQVKCSHPGLMAWFLRRRPRLYFNSSCNNGKESLSKRNTMLPRNRSLSTRRVPRNNKSLEILSQWRSKWCLAIYKDPSISKSIKRKCPPKITTTSHSKSTKGTIKLQINSNRPLTMAKTSGTLPSRIWRRSTTVEMGDESIC
jgi:hypothetical protein